MVAMFAPFENYSSTMLIEMLIVATVNGGLAVAIALIAYFVLGNIFGITTPLQLTELSRPTHPLLRQLLLKASGTYHHTILVSNLAERAAAAIGADALLVRVGAYYHDIGKTVRPYFFAENILDGSSPHEKLDPLTSAQIIISHVKDGVDLAQKYKLPDRIQDFIREHHGRSLVKYFYLQAQRQGENDEIINEEDFRYPGPNPRSRETAVLMLADTCEAAVRAMRPASREELELMVNRLIDERIANGELNESNLTFKELQVVKDVFLHVLQGVHHPRIKYPDNAVTPEVAAQSPALHENGASTTPYRQPRRELGGVEEIAPAMPATQHPAAMDG
jgi:putative nucleotidyltransferase with HDIG domain